MDIDVDFGRFEDFSTSDLGIRFEWLGFEKGIPLATRQTLPCPLGRCRLAIGTDEHILERLGKYNPLLIIYCYSFFDLTISESFSHERCIEFLFLRGDIEIIFIFVFLHFFLQ